MIPPRRSKYGAKPIVVDGVRYASHKEARRFGELQLLQRAGKISELRRQPRFPIEVNGKLVCTYVGDAVYRENGDLVVEDVKGGEATKTPVYKLKRALMLAVHNITIREV